MSTICGPSPRIIVVDDEQTRDCFRALVGISSKKWVLYRTPTTMCIVETKIKILLQYFCTKSKSPFAHPCGFVLLPSTDALWSNIVSYSSYTLFSRHYIILTRQFKLLNSFTDLLLFIHTVVTSHLINITAVANKLSSSPCQNLAPYNRGRYCILEWQF